MKFFPIILFAMAGSIALAGSCGGTRQCQCLYPDGSHCCLYGSDLPRGGDYDCTRLCNGAKRISQTGYDHPQKCNAGGRYSCASYFTAEGRTTCWQPADGPP